ncbi:hypothetical protein SRHO_G00263340 [Serrasalmus rhombeus]
MMMSTKTKTRLLELLPLFSRHRHARQTLWRHVIGRGVEGKKGKNKRDDQRISGAEERGVVEKIVAPREAGRSVCFLEGPATHLMKMEVPVHTQRREVTSSDVGGQIRRAQPYLNTSRQISASNMQIPLSGGVNPCARPGPLCIPARSVNSARLEARGVRSEALRKRRKKKKRRKRPGCVMRRRSAALAAPSAAC